VVIVNHYDDLLLYQWVRFSVTGLQAHELPVFVVKT